MKYLDLTMPLENRTPIYPGSPKPNIQSVATVEKDGYAQTHLDILSHFSTHIDAPSHMLLGGRRLTDYPIEHFIGSAIVLDTKGQKEIKDVDLSLVRKDDIVFLYTAQTDKAYSDDFTTDNPVISEALAHKLAEMKVRIVGLDSYTPDNPPFSIHGIFFKHDIMIVENLVNLKELVGKRFECFIMPLKIQDGDGAPVRVVAKI